MSSFSQPLRIFQKLLEINIFYDFFSRLYLNNDILCNKKKILLNMVTHAHIPVHMLVVMKTRPKVEKKK